MADPNVALNGRLVFVTSFLSASFELVLPSGLPPFPLISLSALRMLVIGGPCEDSFDVLRVRRLSFKSSDHSKTACINV